MATITLEIPDELAEKAVSLSRETLADLIRKAVEGDDSPLPTGGETASGKNGIASLCGKGKGLVWMAPDFNAPLEEFAEYM